MSNQIQIDFLDFALQKNVLKLGEFVTKFGRNSPYFFNTGLFNDGESLLKLANFYAKTIIKNNIEFDVIFGPAYKGIILAAITSLGLAQMGINKPFAYNRKEAKDHGEKGILVGHELKGKILIIDDVISAGTSIRESMDIINKENNATACGVIIALDRMEHGINPILATKEINDLYKIPVYSIANLDDLIIDLENYPHLKKYIPKIKDYKKRYGY